MLATSHLSLFILRYVHIVGGGGGERECHSSHFLPGTPRESPLTKQVALGLASSRGAGLQLGLHQGRGSSLWSQVAEERDRNIKREPRSETTRAGRTDALLKLMNDMASGAAGKVPGGCSTTS